jgi:hypothetical protein
VRALWRHPDAWRPSNVATHGSAAPPIFEVAVARLSNAPSPVERLAEATDFLDLPDRWPALRLYPSAWAGSRSEVVDDG